MPLSSKFFTESTVEKSVQIGHYLAKMHQDKKYNRPSLHFGPPCKCVHMYIMRAFSSKISRIL